MERAYEERNQNDWELRCQLLVTLAGLLSGAMALAVLWAGRQKECGTLRRTDAPCLTALPRMSMGLSLLTGAYNLYTAGQQERDAPSANNRQLLAAAALSGISTALEADILFFRTEDLPPAQRLDTILDVLD